MREFDSTTSNKPAFDLSPHPGGGNLLITIPAELERRERLSNAALEVLDEAMDAHSTQLSQLTHKCCVYITGSLARLEIDESSDLDLFIVDRFEQTASSALTYVEQARLISTLDTVRESSIFKNRPFSRGGGFLHPIPFEDMVAELGDPQDDGKNLFTARMLLLINSRPLLNRDAYCAMREQAVDAYWRGTNSAGELTMPGPDEPHRPIIFVNDLRRWWLTVALNFERQNNHATIASRVKLNDENGVLNPTENPVLHRRLANLKLRYARMLGVFSAFAGILATQSDEGITRNDFVEIISASPIQRLILVSQKKPHTEAAIQSIMDDYDRFLQFVKGAKMEVAQRLLQETVYRPRRNESYRFHAKMASLLQDLGEDSRMLDYILI